MRYVVSLEKWFEEHEEGSGSFSRSSLAWEVSHDKWLEIEEILTGFTRKEKE